MPNVEPHSSETIAALEAEVNDADPHEVQVLHDPENRNIEKGALFPDIISFRKAVRHYVVKRGFEFKDLQTDTTRFIAKCAHPDCPWRIHASKIHDGKTIQIKKLPAKHDCPTTKLRIGKMATQGWCADRCVFSKDSKCDYLTNNVSESFNKQIKELRGLLIYDLVDALRELIMEKMYLRRMVGKTGRILPNVITELNKISNNLKVVKVARSDDDFAEVTLVDLDNVTRRHQVDLENHKCSCRAWQITGKPCRHVLVWILSNRGLQISDYVHEYYSTDKFRTTYEARVATVPDRSQWPVVDLGFKVFPPK